MVDARKWTSSGGNPLANNAVLEHFVLNRGNSLLVRSSGDFWDGLLAGKVGQFDE